MGFETRKFDHMARSSKKPRSFETEVLIIGGGLVGATLATAFGQAGLDVVVVDIQDPKEGLDAGFDGRVSAIAQATQRVLNGLGIWKHLEAAATPIKDIRVSEGDSLLFLHYDHRDADDKPLGHMVENRNLRKALFQRLPELDTVRLLAPEAIKTIERGVGGVTALLAGGQKIHARLVVAADGRGSQTREDAGIRITKWSYNQSAIVCTVAHEHCHDFIAHEHFLPAGPFAILPLMGGPSRPGHCSSLVWTEKPDVAAAIMALDNAGFMTELEHRFGDFLGHLDVTGPKWCYPLALQFAETVIAKRLALVGDAAHGMHPIAGQGLNMGLRDVAALAEVVLDAKRLGLDIGDGTVLERYQRWRRFDNALMLAMTDGLNRIFSNNIRSLRLVRDVGLAAVNRLPPLKRFFMRHAMGLVGDLPRLMKDQPL